MDHSVEVPLAGGTLKIETGKLAGQANGAVTVQYGETVALVTACASPEPREGTDFLPLTVDYEERLYAAGKIPGGFIKREGRPSQAAILAMRLTDRSLRPLFPTGFRHDIQVIVTVLSADQENEPDILSIIGASAALMVSDIPFQGPVSAVRVGYKEGDLLLNPTFTQLQDSKLDLVVASTSDAVVMVEAGASEIPESVLLQAIRFGHEANQQILQAQWQLSEACGKPKLPFTPPEPNPNLDSALSSLLEERLAAALLIGDKGERAQALKDLEREALESLGDTYKQKDFEAAFEKHLKAAVRKNTLEKGSRPDGRGPTTIRTINCAAGTLPRTHGSGLFIRGETQVLSIVTLGSMREEQMLDGISPEESKRFLHHYNFPPFSTGETKRLGAPSRREIGHGALAERALAPVIPDEESFPYTIRVVSEVLSSDGSTSMASVCGSSLALMDAGVPIKAPVAGAAMGLVMDEGRYAILSDIAGIEDALGDMDFKVAGTAQGVTALQMDIKVRGLSFEIMEQALQQARDARLHILERMQETIAASRPELSRYAPRMIKIQVNPDKIRFVIGPGGRTIRSIQEETKVTLDVEDDGTIFIGSNNEAMAEKAISIIRGLTREVEVGGIYTGKVTRIANFGAFVEILPGKEGLVPIGELAEYRVESVEDVAKVGDEIMVMVTEIDKLGRINLSRRAVLQGTPSVSRPSAPSRAPLSRPAARPRVQPRPPLTYPPRRNEQVRERRPEPRGTTPPPPKPPFGKRW